MDIKRIIKRATEEVKEVIELLRYSSLKETYITVLAMIDIRILSRNGYQETTRKINHLQLKHKVLLNYLTKKYRDYYENYDYCKALSNDENMEDCIWICWWQGIDKAPELVKKCIESIKRNAGNHKVIIITDYNYSEYVKFPNWLEEKRKRGVISRTHFSDILRLELLAEHGGLWLDSTFLCVSNNFDTYFNQNVWSIKRPDYAHCSVACGYFANFSLACKYESRRIFVVIRDYLLDYWKKNDTIIDYLLTDYLIVLAQKNCAEVANAFEKIAPNNPCCDNLSSLLGKPYDEHVWKELKEDTSLFKLTWKHEFPLKKNEKDTFYCKLLSGSLY